MSKILQPTACHSTHLKNKLLPQILDLQYSKKEKQGFMAFSTKTTEVLHENIRNNADVEIKMQREANRFLSKLMFSGEHCFNGSLRDPSVQPDPVPFILL